MAAQAIPTRRMGYSDSWKESAATRYRATAKTVTRATGSLRCFRPRISLTTSPMLRGLPRLPTWCRGLSFDALMPMTAG